MTVPRSSPKRILFSFRKSSSWAAPPIGSNIAQLRRPFFGSMASKMLSLVITLPRNSRLWIKRSGRQRLPSPSEVTALEKHSVN
ncbi:hypothetical protein FOTG_18780 [Fusarium oxysporum f. sp. vasinfectum 25433]|uniref:Uncharacterized protein n=1 Tax=Fusarium oxysporum f. sp. vasinfectum 25433 TaxID=1089449 RepID=X0KVL7_FUSOX|nr:hypothetical protein FOTG_18780 [Fusarium oxysporum f. sp. vasinfectum 25433]